jgi:hypothetical protein
MTNIGLTSSDIRAADRRDERKRIADRAWMFLYGVATGASIILFLIAP